MGHEEEWSRLFAGGGEAYARQLASQLESGEREFSPRSWREAEAWHCERSWKATGDRKSVV